MGFKKAIANCTIFRKLRLDIFGDRFNFVLHVMCTRQFTKSKRKAKPHTGIEFAFQTYLCQRHSSTANESVLFWPRRINCKIISKNLRKSKWKIAKPDTQTYNKHVYTNSDSQRYACASALSYTGMHALTSLKSQ